MMISNDVVDAKTAELRELVDQLVRVVLDAVHQSKPIHEVESDTFDIVLRIGRSTLQTVFDILGDGDVGEEYELPDGRTVKRSEEPHERPYMSIFGEFKIERYVYAEREGQKIEFVPMDGRLALPESKFSYLLQDWDQSFAMEEPFGQVSKRMDKILNLKQHVDSLERMNREMAKQAEAFRKSQEIPVPEDEGAIFVQTADGKGVPIRRPADAPAIYEHRHKTGPKPGRKKMATVGAVYSIDPFPRTPEEVVESLFRDPAQPRPKRKRPGPCHKRVMASLSYSNAEGEEINGRAKVFGWISDQMQQRNPDNQKPIIFIMDGEEKLWEERQSHQPNVPMVEVLDLLHVTSRLWRAAHIFYRPGSTTAERFVRDRVLRILRGEVTSVIRGFRRMGTSQDVRGKKKKDLKTICRYFEKNRHRMRYHEFLAGGFPIASGVIEGACRHVVKDRLERTGMNWVLEGAQAMLDLRCIHVSGQWEKFMTFRIASETQRLYPYRDMIHALPWSVAA